MVVPNSTDFSGEILIYAAVYPNYFDKIFAYVSTANFLLVILPIFFKVVP